MTAPVGIHAATTPRSSIPQRSPIIDVVSALGRFVTLVLPQVLASAGALYAFHRWLYFPLDYAWVHLPFIAAFQCVFVLAFAGLLRRGKLNRGAAQRYYAAAIFLKAAALNAVYLASFGANRLWGDNFTWANLASTGRHIAGFHAAFGSTVYWMLGGIAAVIALFALALQATRGWLIAHLRWAAAASGSGRPGRAVPLAVTCGVVALAAASCWLPLSLPDTLRTDPLFSFWLGIDQHTKPDIQTADDFRAREQYPAVADFRRKNVIMVVVDCLRSDHVPLFGYERNTTPFLAELHASGLVQPVAHSVSVGNDSPQGIFAVLTSRHPENITPASFKIYEALQRQGYRTHAIVSGDHSYLGGLRRFYGTGLDVFVDGMASKSRTVNDDALIVDALERLPVSDGTPSFFFFHLMSVHLAGARDAAFDEWTPCLSDSEKGKWLFGQSELQVLVNTYDNSIRQADDYLRRIWSILGAKGYLQDYVAAVTGDHGEGLGERGHFGHTQFLHYEDVQVPILFIDSEKKPFGSMPFASQIDIAPTLLDRLGLPQPDTWEGMSLIDSPGRSVAFLASRRKGQWRAVIQRNGTETYKYLFFGPLHGTFREHLFELNTDPYERHDLLASASAETLAPLRDLATRHFKIDLPTHASALR